MENEYLGKVGERLTFNAIVEKRLAFPSVYGYTYLNVMNVDGACLVWKGSAPIEGENGSEVVGASITICGTIKAHNNYKGTCQTIINRCKYSIVSVPEQPIDKAKREQFKRLESEPVEIWRKMPYRQYKEHYSDCETVVGSYLLKNGNSYVDVIIPEGRLKASGTRGQRYSTYTFKFNNGKIFNIRAVSIGNALKQMKKHFPNLNPSEYSTE